MTYEETIVYKNIEYPTIRHMVYATRFDSLETLPKNGVQRGAKSVVAELALHALPTLKEIPISNKNYHKEVEDIVKYALKQRIENDTTGDYLRELLDTGDAVLVYSAPYDLYWGTGSSKVGVNRLGVLLEEIREEYRRALE